MAENNKPNPQKDGGNGSTKAMDEVLKRLEQLEKENQLLLKVADKHRLSKHRDPHDNGPKKIRVRTMEVREESGEYVRKLIVGWGRMIKNHVNPKTAYDENTQVVEIFFHDGTKQELTYYDFAVTYDHKEEVEVLSINQDQKARENIYVFEWNDEEYKIAERFIN